MGKLLDFIKGSPSPKPIEVKPIYDTSKVLIYTYEYNLLRVAAFERGKRREAIKKLKTFVAWRLANREK